MIKAKRSTEINKNTWAFFYGEGDDLQLELSQTNLEGREESVYLTKEGATKLYQSLLIELLNWSEFYEEV